MGIITLTQLKDYVGESTNTYDDFLTDQIVLIQAAMEGYCGRKFDEASYTQVYYRDFITQASVPKIWTFHYPVSAIASITEDTLVDTDDYLLKPNNGQIRRMNDNSASVWFKDSKKITAIYTAGYATGAAPRDLQQVVYAIGSENYSKKVAGVNINFGSNIQRISIAGVMSIDFDYTLDSNNRMAAYGMILGDWANVLDSYRSERAVLGEIHENYVS